MKRAEHQPETLILTVYAGIYTKVYRVPDAGTFLPQHSHTFGHQTVLIAGKVKVWRGEEVLGIYQAPAVIEIPADTLHSFLALCPDVVLACIHNADRIEGDEPAVSQHATLELED